MRLDPMIILGWLIPLFGIVRENTVSASLQQYTLQQYTVYCVHEVCHRVCVRFW